jgi:hypothetical protein
VALAPDRDLTLLHRLEKRALHFRRGAVDLVREEEVREDRTERGLELAVLLVVDARANEVGGHEVRGELDPLEVALDRARDRLDREGLGQPRNALDQKVAAREQPDEDPLEHVVLSDDDPLHLIKEAAHLGLSLCCEALIHLNLP